MNRARWLILGGSVAAVVAGLCWMTELMLRFERAERDAMVQAEHREALRLGLWRMDSRMVPFLATEAARPYFEYLSFHPQQRAYTRLLTPIEAGEVLTPSPLLSGPDDPVRIYFQWHPLRGLSSPSVPTGEQLVLARTTGLDEAVVSSQQRVLDSLAGRLDPDSLTRAVDRAEHGLARHLEKRGDGSGARGAVGEDGVDERSLIEFGRRALADARCRAPEPDAAAAEVVVTGPLVPLWLVPPPPEVTVDLIFVRSVVVAETRFLQGMLCDWTGLRAELLREVSDLLPEASLVPVDAEARMASTRRLATLPVELQARPVSPVVTGWWTPTRIQLVIAWLAAALAIAAVLWTLRASLDLSERRHRFASAVTHELRTPLTTFRLYSEMLADGMVSDAGQRQEYLETLKAESARLATLVENVLSYARLEEGLTQPAFERLTIGELLERVQPPLARRAEQDGMRLEASAGSAELSWVQTDPGLVGQILFSLVDNACKHAACAEDRTVPLDGCIEGDELVFRVRDHGPGIPLEHARAIFHPFDRGGLTPAAPVPGLGLGLALARDLARNIGGDLELDASVESGALFILRLPVAA